MRWITGSRSNTPVPNLFLFGLSGGLRVTLTRRRNPLGARPYPFECRTRTRIGRGWAPLMSCQPTPLFRLCMRGRVGYHATARMADRAAVIELRRSCAVIHAASLLLCRRSRHRPRRGLRQRRARLSVSHEAPAGFRRVRLGHASRLPRTPGSKDNAYGLTLTST